MLKAPRGVFDILPPDTDKWVYLEELLRKISRVYNFREIRTPHFEHTEVFSRTVGEATDIVEKEMYTFEDKAGRGLTLRPEGTAPVARAFLEHGMSSGPLPAKFFYIGSMFRYEKPQAGRYREFRQYGAEILGSMNPLSDLEVIMLSVDIAGKLGLSGTKLVINSIGCPACRQRYREDLIDYLSLREEQLCGDCRKRLRRNPLRVIDCKTCRDITNEAPSMLDYLCDDCRKHWDGLRDGLTSVGLDYSIDGSLVRGLDYYTRTVFELRWPPLGAQDALLGGGRYDGLVEELGGNPTPGVGFAMGLERILVAMEKGSNPVKPEKTLDVFVIAKGGSQGEDEAAKRGFKLVQEIRGIGLSSDFDHLGRSIKAAMKHADRLGARYVLIIGEKEISENTVSVKSMQDGRQTEVARDEVLSFLRKEV